MSDSLSGQTIGRYQVINQIGKGGMAEVYKGYQESLDRYVAIKVMHTFLSSEEDFLLRFQREARAMASMSHPHIVGVYDFDVYGENSYYLVMEYIDGGTLKEYLENLRKEGKSMPLENAVRICQEVADALAYAHRRQMIHRDIKPANVMLDEETGKAILTDFGIVKLVGNTSAAYTATGALVGTPAYMSPEQALGQTGDERVDIYSLGVMLFQMVTGQLPFDADTPLAVVLKHVNEQPPLPMNFNPDVPLDLQEVILKALAKDPNDRYQTAREMHNALKKIDFSGPLATSVAAGTAVPASTPSSPTLSTPPETAASATPPADANAETAVPAAPVKNGRPPWLYALAALIALGIIGGGLAAAGVFGGNPDPTEVPIVAVLEETEEPAGTETPSREPSATVTPVDQAAIVRTVLAEEALTRAALATETPTPSRTPTKTPTPTATIDPTVQFAQTCTDGVELVSLVRQFSSSNFVPTDSVFTLIWTLRNSGTCTWPAGSVWTYLEGAELGFTDNDAVELEEAVVADEEVTVSTQLGSIDEVGTLTAVWQLTTPSGDPIGEPVEFRVRGFVPVTPTPVPTNTPEAPVVETQDGFVNWTFDVGQCEYLGDNLNWRCQVNIYPYIDGVDGVTGNFTVFIFDQPAGQATTYRGVGPFSHFALARRCAAYNQGIRVIDDVTETQVDGFLYIDPNNAFSGGCTE